MCIRRTEADIDTSIYLGPWGALLIYRELFLGLGVFLVGSLDSFGIQPFEL